MIDEKKALLINEFKKNYEEYEIIATIGKDTWQIKQLAYERIAVLKKINNIEVYKSLKTLNLSGIPVIYDAFEKDGSYYIIEEYINGKSLSEVLASEGRLSKSRARKIISQLCRILEPIHKNNIIHRDIKPSNIILTSNNSVYLIDFGIARKKNESSNEDTKHLGTEFYASPEQYGFAQTDNKSDIYSIGKLLIVLLTGKEDSNDLKGVSYKGIINKCISIDRKNRFKTVGALNLSFYTQAIIPFIIIGVIVLIMLSILALKVNIKKTLGINGELKTEQNQEIISERGNNDKESQENEVESSTEESALVTTEGETTKESTAVTTTEGETTKESTAVTTTEGETTKESTTVATTQEESSIVTTQTKTQGENKADNQVKNEPVAVAEDKASEEELSENESSDEITDNNTTIIYDKNVFSGIVYSNGMSDRAYDEIGYMFFSSDELKEQTVQLNLGENVNAELYGKYEENGLRLSINGKSVFCPLNKIEETLHIANDTIYPDEIVDVYEVLFTDCNSDGVNDLFVLNIKYIFARRNEYEEFQPVMIYAIGNIITVDKDLNIKLCDGDKIEVFLRNIVEVEPNYIDIHGDDSEGRIRFDDFWVEDGTVKKYSSFVYNNI